MFVIWCSGYQNTLKKRNGIFSWVDLIYTFSSSLINILLYAKMVWMVECIL